MCHLITLSLTAAFLLSVVDAQSWDNLNTLRPGDRIKVVDQKLREFKGTFLSVSEIGLSFRTAVKERPATTSNQQVTLSRMDVFRVNSMGKSSRQKNTRIGLIVGAAAGAALLGGTAAARCCNSDYTPSFIVGLSTAMGAGIGAAAGAAVGHITSLSDTIYRAERRQR